MENVGYDFYPAMNKLVFDSKIAYNFLYSAGLFRFNIFIL